MKRSATLFVFLLFVTAASAQQPQVNSATKYPFLYDNPEFLLGTDRLCPSGPQQMTPAPKGYEAFYISHYGRHGARYASQDDLYSYLLSLCEQAQEVVNLTKDGKKLFAALNDIYSEASVRAGDLSDIGWAHQQKLAERMYLNFPGVFADGAKVNTYTSTSTRCVMTMSSFCLGLKEKNPKLDITEHYGNVYLHGVLPQSSSDPFREKYCRETPLHFPDGIEQYKAERLDPVKFLSRFFVTPENTVSKENQWKTIEYIYFFINGMECIGGPDLTGLLTTEDRIALWDIDNIQFYLDAWPKHYGYMPVLEDMIKKSDEAIANAQKGADLRFAHDYTVYPLMMILGINGMDHDCSSAAEVSDWFQNQNIPMGASVQFVFYRNPKNPEILFKVLLNGVEAKLPIETGNWPYYKWNDFKNHYEDVAFAGPDEISVGPWVTNATDSTVSILWTTKSEGTGWVETADGQRHYCTYAGRRDFGVLHRVDVKGTPGQHFRYRIGGEPLKDDSDPYGPVFGRSWCGDWHSVKFLDRNAKGTHFVVTNDIHLDTISYRKLINEVDISKTDFIFLNGDIASADNYTLDKFLKFEIEPLGDYAAQLPVIFTRGNHEGRGNGIRIVGQVYPNHCPAENGFYYTFRQGPAAFLILDAGETGERVATNFTGGPRYDDYLAEQIEWAKTALYSKEFAEAPLKICMLHVPMVDHRIKDGYHLQRWLNQNFLPLLNEAGIDVMIGADLHEHLECLPGSMGNNFPIIVNSSQKRLEFDAENGKMNIRCYDAAGHEYYNAVFSY